MKYRSEWKYECEEVELKILETKLKCLLQFDKNSNSNTGIYTIRSLYFDDLSNSCMFDNDAGLEKRYKYRIRYYGNDNNNLYLEKKIKYLGFCSKKVCNINLNDYNKIIKKEYIELYNKYDSHVLKEFCIDCITKGFRPVVIVDYDRAAYVDEALNIRITIDRNICASQEIDKFITGNYLRYPIQETNKNILEIKFDDILPSHIVRSIDTNGLSQTTFSKYYLSRIKMMGVI